MKTVGDGARLRVDLIQRLEEPSLSLALAVRRRLLTFEAPAQNSLALGFLLSLSAVEYLTLEERKAIVDPISAVLRDKRVADFMRADPVVVARRIR